MRAWRPFLATMLLVLFVTSCSFSGSDTEATPTVDQGNGSLRIFVAGESRTIKPFHQFTEATGIKIEAQFAPQQEWVERLQANREKPGADLFWSDNAIDLAILSNLGLFEPYDSPLANALPDYGRDHDGRWYGLTERRLALVYSPSTLSTVEMPTTIEEFIHTPWQHTVAVPPATSRLWTRFLTEVVAFEGEMALLQLLESLNQLTFDLSEESMSDVQHVANGDVAALLTTSDIGMRWMTDNEQATNEVHMQPLASQYAEHVGIVTGVAILRGTEQRQAAEALVDFLLEPDRRRSLAEQDSHEQLLTEQTDEQQLPRLHPDEMAALVPLVEHYWQIVLDSEVRANTND